MKTHARVVVIGGGAMGVSLLYHLTKLGWNDVVLVEKNELTAGSTWHAAGLCTHFAHNATIMEMRATSVRLYRDLLPIEQRQGQREPSLSGRDLDDVQRLQLRAELEKGEDAERTKVSAVLQRYRSGESGLDKRLTSTVVLVGRDVKYSIRTSV